MRRLLRSTGFVLLGVFVLSAGACAEGPTSPSAVTPFIQTDLSVGTGAEATSTSRVSVNYTGWLYDSSKADQKGLQFDTSLGRGPFSFTLGANEVIEGWNRGVVGMKVGGTRRLTIPPSLAYGDRRNGPIPPNSALIFEIELLSVE